MGVRRPGYRIACLLRIEAHFSYLVERANRIKASPYDQICSNDLKLFNKFFLIYVQLGSFLAMEKAHDSFRKLGIDLLLFRKQPRFCFAVLGSAILEGRRRNGPGNPQKSKRKFGIDELVQYPNDRTEQQYSGG